MTLAWFFSVCLTPLTLYIAGTCAQNSTNGTTAGIVNATTIFQRPSELLALPLRRVGHHGIATPSLRKRFFKTDVLGVFGAAYLAQLTIGTSDTQQTVSVLLDTGSFELWVDPDCDASNVPSLCNDFGHYDPALSSTSRNLNQPYAISYGSGGSSGTYYTDDVYINSAQIRNQQFGVANKTNVVWFGVMGLAHGQGDGFLKYSTIIDSLATQRYTQSRLFSLDLGGQIPPAIGTTGQIVFGGVDRNKYSGTLGKVPTNSSDPHYTITLTGLSHHAPGATTTQPILDIPLPLSVVIDSGTTLSLLPERVVRALAAAFPGAVPDGNGGYTVPCAYQGRDGSVEFSFSGGAGSGVVHNITVAYRDFVWNSGGDRCFLGAWYTPDVHVWILGDTFLRGAYVAFDLDNDALYMANYISCGSAPDLVPVPAGPDAAANIPGACQVAGVPEMTPVPTSTTFSGAATISTISPINPEPTIDDALGSQSTTATTPPTSVPSPSPSSSPRSSTAALSSGSSTPSSATPLSSTTPAPLSPSRSSASASGDVSSHASINNEILPSSPTSDTSSTQRSTNAADTAARDTTTTYTYTSTVTEVVIITRTVDPGGPARIVTSFRTYVTTFCDTVDNNDGGKQPTPIGLPVVFAASTTPTNPPVAAEASGDIAPTPAPEVAHENKVQTVKVVTEHCSTSTYVLTTCGSDGLDEEGCTIGMTTTRVVTEHRTVHVVQTVTVAAEAVLAEAGVGAGPGVSLSMPPPLTTDLTQTTAAVQAQAQVAAIESSYPSASDITVADDTNGEASLPSTTAVVSPAPIISTIATAAAAAAAVEVVISSAGPGFSWPLVNGSSGDGENERVGGVACFTCRDVNVNALPTGFVAVVSGAEGRREVRRHGGGVLVLVALWTGVVWLW